LRASKEPIIRRATYDFGDLVSEGTQSIVLRRSIPAPYSRGTLMVRVHALDIGSGSDGDITVSVRADGFTSDDPAQLFFGETLAEVVAAADGDSAPRYLVQVFEVKSDQLVVQLDATQASNNVLALSARISVDLLLDDGPLPAEDPWTPAELAPEGWWRADLGHALADQDPVASWANQGTAGSAGDVGQGTSTLRPTYVASHASFNGQAVLSFDGGDLLYATAGTWWHLPSESSSAVVIAVARSTISGNSAVITTRGVTTVGGLDARLKTNGTACQARWYQSGAAVSITDSGANGAQNSVHVLASVLTGAVTTATDSGALWVDGASGAPTTADFTAPVAASSNREWVVAGTTTTAADFTGQIAEVLFLKRVLSAEEDSALTDYLNERYGLALTGVTQ